MTAADSMIAVCDFESHHQHESIGSRAALTVFSFTGLALSICAMIAPKPSPPSLTGNKVRLSFGRTFLQPRAMAAAAFSAVNVPLNLSGQMRMFTFRMQARR